MKQKILTYFILVTACIGLHSCLFQQDDYFDKSSAERAAADVIKCSELLKSSPNGWLLEYYIGSGYAMGGITLLCKFDDKKVTMASTLSTPNVPSGVFIESLYQVVSEQSTMLTFDSYNELIHAFAAPAGSGNDANANMGGDYEFIIMDASDNQITLLGKKYGNTMTMTRMPVTTKWKEYIRGVNEIEENAYLYQFDIMAGGEKMNPKDMAYYLKTGDVTMDMVDEKVRHILRILIAFGFKDGTEADKSIALDDPQSVETALNVAREGLVLLKNENNILPINPQKYKHIIITGKNAHGYVHGGGSGAVVPFHYTNLFDGIQKEGKLNNVKVEYIDELDFMPSIMYTDDNLNEKGFHAEYFKNIHFEGAPVVKQTEKKINYSWAAGTELEGMPKDYFSVKWYSTMCVDETADYEFTLGGDDGYKLFINDQPIIDDWTPGGFRTTNVTKTLKAGEKYHVRVEYYQQGGGAGICFLWKRKNETQNKFADYLNKADLVIACFGHSSDTEGEASDRTFELPEVDINMLVN